MIHPTLLCAGSLVLCCPSPDAGMSPTSTGYDSSPTFASPPTFDYSPTMGPDTVGTVLTPVLDPIDPCNGLNASHEQSSGTSLTLSTATTNATAVCPTLPSDAEDIEPVISASPTSSEAPPPLTPAVSETLLPPSLIQAALLAGNNGGLVVVIARLADSIILWLNRTIFPLSPAIPIIEPTPRLLEPPAPPFRYVRAASIGKRVLRLGTRALNLTNGINGLRSRMLSPRTSMIRAAARCRYREDRRLRQPLLPRSPPRPQHATSPTPILSGPRGLSAPRLLPPIRVPGRRTLNRRRRDGRALPAPPADLPPPRDMIQTPQIPSPFGPADIFNFSDVTSVPVVDDHDQPGLGVASSTNMHIQTHTHTHTHTNAATEADSVPPPAAEPGTSDEQAAEACESAVAVNGTNTTSGDGQGEGFVRRMAAFYDRLTRGEFPITWYGGYC